MTVVFQLLWVERLMQKFQNSRKRKDHLMELVQNRKRGEEKMCPRYADKEFWTNLTRSDQLPMISGTEDRHSFAY